MNDEAPIQTEVSDSPIGSAEQTLRRREADASTRSSGGVLTIVVAATFTADPLCRPLRFWMHALEIDAEISLAPYAQLMQELLNPESLLSRNQHGFNLLLVRLEDWIRDRMHESVERNIEHIRTVATDFAAAIGKLGARTSAATFIYLCPSSSTLAAAYRKPLEELQRHLADQFAELPLTHCWAHSDLVQLYPVPVHEDPRADHIGHIPYAAEYSAAIATLFARRVAALLKPQYKVIVVDCDNTLWKGICGEDGAAGVELTPAYMALQRVLVRQQDAGVLLCVCSRNNPDDVESVFRERSEMVLRDEHLICRRVNWNSKSENLHSLALELDLSLDSFVFIDDSPLECAEVRAHCPGMLVLQLPQSERDILHFLNHTWAFDRVGVTEEARERTQQYRQNRARNIALREATDFEQFLASLDLKVAVSEMQPEQLSRVAELVQRTNQFNLTGVRRRAGELELLLRSGELRCLVVHVCDRFGDYGLVGAVLFASGLAAIEVDTFVLSCRVLGRGVEHRIVRELAHAARQEGRTHVTLKYRRSARNEPARSFLENTFAEFCDSRAEQGAIAAVSSFRIPVSHAETLDSSPTMHAREGVKPALPEQSTASATTSVRWHETASDLSRVADIVAAINEAAPKPEGQRGDYVAPTTPTQQAVAEIWARVLGLAEVGIRDDFFDLGGDSVLAVQVIASIGSSLGLELSLYDFFEEPTIEKIAGRLTGASGTASTIEHAEHGDSAPLSSAQQRLWFIDRLGDGGAAYNVPLSLRLRGELDRAALQAALNGLVSRHEVLRTTFHDVDGVPRQVIASDGRFVLVTIDLATVPPQVREAAMVAEAKEETGAPFDLEVGPLIRGRLLRLSQDDCLLLITMHHIIADGWSLGVLIKELSAIYEACREGRTFTLPPLPIQYADYARWQQTWLKESPPHEQLSYWVDHLREAPAVLELPADRPRPTSQSYRGASAPVSLGATLAAHVIALSRRLNLTLAMSLHTAWSILLSRLSGQADVIVGIPVANRGRTELESLIGLFADTLAIRLRFEDDPGVEDALRSAKKVMLDAYDHQDAPFERVVEALQPERSLSHSPVFQVMFAFKNVPFGPLQFAGLTVSEQETPSIAAQFDLLLVLQQSGDDICGHLNYATDLFDRTTIERWVDSFKCVLSAMVHHSHLQISRIPLLNDNARRRVLNEFNATQAPFAQEKLLHQLFEEQAVRTPAAVAVTFEGLSLTYAELNARANQLGHHLRARGAGPDRPVGICIERSLEMVVALLGVLKAGSAYVPLDPNYPTERLEYMLQDAAPSVLLTQEHLKQKLTIDGMHVIALDSGWDTIAAGPCDELEPKALGLHSGHLAYVIYTSGSTGQPKGAMNEHRALVNRLQWMQDQYQLSHDDVVLQKTPFSFDVSVWEFFWTLMTGARLVVARPQGHQDPAYLTRLIEESATTTLHFVPSMLQIFLEQLRPGQCPSLRRVVCSGEELPVSLQHQFFERLPHARLSNLYGPTEAAVDVTYWECQAEDESSRVPIGRPISNVRMYVLDRHLQPVPIGVVGELYIGGAGVGRGYLRRPDLTAERFVADPFTPSPLARMYKTGDVGRWRADGVIEYLGRNDHQIKIRGLRIELGEIEAQLLRHEHVKEVAVIAREDGSSEKRLVAYVVLRGQASASDAEALRAHLQRVLPDYMVPSLFVTLQYMPLTPNGKLDRCGLPEPDFTHHGSNGYEAPVGEVEDVLAGLWRSLLNVDRVGRDDNFFRLGGTSLSAMQVQARAEAALSLEIPTRLLFESPTLRGLAARLESLRRVRLFDDAARSGIDVKGLMGQVASLRQSEVRELLGEWSREGRP